MERYGMEDQRAEYLSILGAIEGADDNDDIAVSYLEEALRLFRTQRRYAGVANVAAMLGQMYGGAERYEAALPYLVEAQHCFLQINGLHGYAVVTAHILLCMNELGRLSAEDRKRLALAALIQSRRSQESMSINEVRRIITQVFEDERERNKIFREADAVLASDTSGS